MNRIDLQVILTVATAICFVLIFYWAYSKKNTKRFEEAANLPFADEDKDQDEHPSEGDKP